MLTALIAHNNHQHGPPSGSASLVQYWVLIPLLILGAVIILYLYRSWFPRFNAVQPTERLKDQIDQHTETALSSPSASSNRKGIEKTPSNMVEEASSIDVVLRLLETDERRIVEALLEEGDSM